MRHTALAAQRRRMTILVKLVARHLSSARGDYRHSLSLLLGLVACARTHVGYDHAAFVSALDLARDYRETVLVKVKDRDRSGARSIRQAVRGTV